MTLTPTEIAGMLADDLQRQRIRESAALNRYQPSTFEPTDFESRHLPGKHDQKSHGRKGPAALAKAAAKKAAKAVADAAEAKKKPAPRKRAGKAANKVALRDYTREKLDAAMAVMPKSDGEWRALFATEHGESDSDRYIRERRERLAESRKKLKALERERERIRQRVLKKALGPLYDPKKLKGATDDDIYDYLADVEINAFRRQFGAKDVYDVNLAVQDQISPAVRDVNQRIDAAQFAVRSDQADLDYVVGNRARIEREIAAGTASQFDRDQLVPKPQPRYDKDPNGVALPTAELREVHDRVIEAGEALRSDIATAYLLDPQWQRINQEYLRQDSARWDFTQDGRVRKEARAAADRLLVQRRQLEQEFTLDALRQLRPIGNKQHGTVAPNVAVPQGSGAGSVGGLGQTLPARADWKPRLRLAERYFPDDWVQRSGGNELTIASSDRAFHTSRKDWDGPNGAGVSTLAMNTDAANDAHYGGAFPSQVDEITVHEMGHRMEQQIPGIKALEFAYVRSRTVNDKGEVEAQRSLKDLVGGGYESYEMTYKDDFVNAYTGKVYGSQTADDPATQAWEVFQVGLQQTLGRSRVFDDARLEDFTLGVLATVGRADV